MKIKILIVFLLTCMALAPARSAMALGIGVFADGSYNALWIEGLNGTMEYGFTGAGLVLDTCAARNELFNYRFQVGYQKDVKNSEVGTHKISINNYFGFGLVRMRYFRFFIGPQLGLRYYMMDRKDKGDWGFTRTIRSNEAGAAAGLVLGLNVNIGEYFTLGLDFGCRYNLLFRDPLIHGPEGHGALSFMYRIDDVY